MKLNLKRPIVFFDLETTGVDTAKDRIVEISMVKVMPDGEEIVKTRKINPGIHIPEEATAIHGITDEDVKECPTFAQIARSLEQFIAGCDFGGFNSNRFDLRWRPTRCSKRSWTATTTWKTTSISWPNSPRATSRPTTPDAFSITRKGRRSSASESTKAAA